MNPEVIGHHAGIVWKTLNTANDQTLKSIKKATKLKDRELLLAVGWLAREGKILFNYEEDDVILTLA